jgi:integrase
LTTVVLGLKSELKKHEAEAKLRAHITEKTQQVPKKPDADPTFGWFWSERFVPTRPWNPGTKATVTCCFAQHILPVIGGRKLREIEKHEIDLLVKKLAESYSDSIVHKARTYIKAAFEDAIDVGLLERNPARKITRWETRETCKRFLSIEEIGRLLDAMEGVDRLVAKICIVLGPRPGEVFATKWDDFDAEGGRLRIDESAAEWGLKKTKTPGSRAWLWLSKPIWDDLKALRATSTGNGFIFPSKKGTPMRTKNFLRRNIWPAAIRAGLMTAKPEGWPKGKQWIDPTTSVNFKAFRRTCATYFHQVAGAKNTQAQLRHASPATTLGVYVQELPESVRAAVETLDELLCGKRPAKPVETIQ